MNVNGLEFSSEKTNRIMKTKIDSEVRFDPSTDSEVRFDITVVIKYLVHCLLVKRYRCHFLLDSFNLWTNL